MNELRILHPGALVRLVLPEGFYAGAPRPMAATEGQPVSACSIATHGAQAGTVTVRPTPWQGPASTTDGTLKWLPPGAKLVDLGALPGRQAADDGVAFAFRLGGRLHHAYALSREVGRKLTLTAVTWAPVDASSDAWSDAWAELRAAAQALLAGARAHAATAPRWAMQMLYAALGMNLLEAIASALDRVPVYGGIGGTAFWPLSVLVALLLAGCMHGVAKREAWGYLAATVSLAMLGTTALAAAVLASEPGFYVPALARGGLHEALWVTNTIFNLIVAFAIWVRHRQVFEHLD